MTRANKRMGDRESTTSIALLDAAERVIRKEGYGAATSRRIAEEAGFKQQLVYYYFCSVDDLLLAMFRRRVERALIRLEDEMGGGQAIENIWANWTRRQDVKTTFELLTLAYHNTGIRNEVVRFMEIVRKKHSEAIQAELSANNIQTGPLTPTALAFILFSLSLIMNHEEHIGITTGHDDIRQLFAFGMEYIKLKSPERE